MEGAATPIQRRKSEQQDPEKGQAYESLQVTDDENTRYDWAMLP